MLQDVSGMKVPTFGKEILPESRRIRLNSSQISPRGAGWALLSHRRGPQTKKPPCAGGFLQSFASG
jgi:hypothetical protein